MPEFSGQSDLRNYLRVFWRWKFLFLVFVIAAPAAAYLMERGKPKVYGASALVGVNQATVSSAALTGGGSFSTNNVVAIAKLVTTSPVAAVAADLLHPPTRAGAIVGEVSASGDPATNFLTISAQDRSPTRAAQIANAFAKAIDINLKKAAISEIDGSIQDIRAQLANLKAGDPTRVTLQQQITQLLAAKSTQGGQAAILQPAAPNFSPVGPHIRRTVELAVLIGLLLGFGAIVLAENADRRLRSPEDLEALTKLPLLAAVDSNAFSSELETGVEDEEAFNMLRTALMFFNVDKPLASVLVTSAGEKEGKTTVSTRLAIAAAQAGLAVTLVDADLRRAQVSSKLSIRARVGFGAVIAGEVPLESALVEYPLSGLPDGGRLKVLPSGPPPPNPSALLSSDKAVSILRQLESQSDLVIIDTPAALAVSDPLPLMRRASGVVMIARMNQSTRQSLRRLHKIIESAHGTLLGCVATGVSAGPGYEHYYPKYYSRNGTHESGGRLRRRRKKADVVAETPVAGGGMNGSHPVAQPAPQRAEDLGVTSVPFDE